MSLWGKTDALASAPKFVATTTTVSSASVGSNAIDLTNTATNWATGTEVKYTVISGASIGGLTTGSTYYIRRITADKVELYDTRAHAIAATNITTGRVSLTAAVGVVSLQNTGAANPAGFTSDGKPFGEHIYNGGVLLFIDDVEAQEPANKAKGLDKPGWWNYRTYTDTQSRVRHKAEHLVFLNAAPAIAGDTLNDSTDTIVIDGIVISTQPTNMSVTAPATASFSVVASVTPSVTLSYQWQKQESGATSWSNVGTNASSYTTGATTVLADNGDKYRVIVSATGHDPVTSNSVTLTVA